MNNKEYIAALAADAGFTAAATQKMVGHVLSAMGDRFMEGDTVGVQGFGSFDVKKKLERIIVNPSTGQRMLVPPKLVLGFRPTDEWKDKMRGKNGQD